MSRKSICKACFIERHGIKTRISVEHTCWSKGIEPLLKIVSENEISRIIQKYASPK